MFYIKKEGLPFEVEATRYTKVIGNIAIKDSSDEKFYKSNCGFNVKDLGEMLKGNERGAIVILNRRKNLFQKIDINYGMISVTTTEFVSDESIEEVGIEYFEKMIDHLRMDNIAKLREDTSIDIEGAIEDLADEVSENEEMASLEMFMKDIKVSDYEQMTLSEFKDEFCRVFDEECMQEYGITSNENI